MIIHTVKRGESIYSIAAEYGVCPKRLGADNGLYDGRAAEGDKLIISLPSRTYTVHKYDTVEAICSRFGLNAEELMRMNTEMRGLPSVYEGQVLAVRRQEGKFGMASAIGYLYPGVKRDELLCSLPYLDTVAICAAVLKNCEVIKAYNEGELLSLVKAAGKAALLRVYAEGLPDDVGAAISSMIIAAKAGGYSGIVLGGVRGDDRRRYSEFVLECKREMLNCDLSLLTEANAGCEAEHTEYSDGCIASYDKIHLANIPSFEEGEMEAYTDFAEKYDAPRCYMEIGAFAYIGGRYITKNAARRTASRKGARVEHNDTTLINLCNMGNGREPMVWESAENIKARLELVSELGLMGICFDIGRVDIGDLVMLSEMFSPTPRGMR